jgi:hypothetical protein
MKRAIVAALAALLAVAATPHDACAEEQYSSPRLFNGRVMVSFAAPNVANEGMLRESLEAAIAASPLAQAVLRFAGDEDGLAPSAARNSCPVAIEVEATETGEGMHIEWRFIAADAGGIELRAGSFDKAAPAPRDLVSAFWVELVQDTGPAIDALPRDIVAISGPPGVRIDGVGESFVMPDEGRVELPMHLPAFVSWRTYSRDFLDASGTALIDASTPRLDLILEKVPRWAVDLSFYVFSFPEARASWLLGKRFFARTTITQFLAGLNLQSYSGPPPEPSFIASYSLIQAGFGFGGFLEDPDKKFRAYAALDAFLRLAMPYSSDFFIDPVAPVGIHPVLGAEWGMSTRSKLYLEFGGIFYPYADTVYMKASRKNDNGGDNSLSFGHWSLNGHPGWALEFPVPRLGIKMYF